MESKGDKETRKTKAVLVSETVIKELVNIRKTWGEAQKIAMNRIWWKAMVEALCLTRGKEV